MARLHVRLQVFLMKDAMTAEILERMLKALGSTTDAALARALNVSPQAISEARRKGKVPATWAITLASNYPVSLDWLLFGREPDSSGNKNNIAERIKLVRSELSQDDFSKSLDIHKNSLGRYERGESTPGVDVAGKICLVFGVNPQWLLLGTGPMKAGPITDVPLEETPAFREKGSKAAGMMAIKKDIEIMKLKAEIEALKSVKYSFDEIYDTMMSMGNSYETALASKDEAIRLLTDALKKACEHQITPEALAFILAPPKTLYTDAPGSVPTVPSTNQTSEE